MKNPRTDNWFNVATGATLVLAAVAFISALIGIAATSGLMPGLARALSLIGEALLLIGRT